MIIYNYFNYFQHYTLINEEKRIKKSVRTSEKIKTK